MVSDPIACLWMWVWIVDVLRRFGYRGYHQPLLLGIFLSLFSSLVLHGFMCSGSRFGLRDAPSGGTRSQKPEAGSSDSVCEGGGQGLVASASLLFEKCVCTAIFEPHEWRLHEIR